MHEMGGLLPLSHNQLYRAVAVQAVKAPQWYKLKLSSTDQVTGLRNCIFTGADFYAVRLRAGVVR